jgi:CRP-like cAMP-binding protein
VQRFLSQQYSAGHTLTEGDVDRLRRLLIRRDGWIEMYQPMELSKNRVIAEKNGMIAAMGRHARAALSGYGRRGQPRRVLRCLGRKPRPDHASPARASLGHGVARLAADSSPGARIDVVINGESAGAYPIGGGSFACRVRPSRHLRGHLFGLAATSGRANRSAASGQGQELV